jgi:hypothetical protein
MTFAAMLALSFYWTSRERSFGLWLRGSVDALETRLPATALIAVKFSGRQFEVASLATENLMVIKVARHDAPIIPLEQ